MINSTDSSIRSYLISQPYVWMGSCSEQQGSVWGQVWKLWHIHRSSAKQSATGTCEWTRRLKVEDAGCVPNHAQDLPQTSLQHAVSATPTISLRTPSTLPTHTRCIWVNLVYRIEYLYFFNPLSLKPDWQQKQDKTLTQTQPHANLRFHNLQCSKLTNQGKSPDFSRKCRNEPC